MHQNQTGKHHPSLASSLRSLSLSSSIATAASPTRPRGVGLALRDVLEVQPVLVARCLHSQPSQVITASACPRQCCGSFKNVMMGTLSAEPKMRSNRARTLNIKHLRSRCHDFQRECGDNVTFDYATNVHGSSGTGSLSS
ncbi:hypothetical protein BDR06DRAFT_301419 [Suillus hirtellus]|nr:hypothetical protein BDR06DRAFT_301419 [Suillus hirtellus]